MSDQRLNVDLPAIKPNESQAELFPETRSAVKPAPAHELSEWKTFPGDLQYRRLDEKTTEIDFDGKMVRATRGSGDRYSAPEILGEQRPRGFRNFMSRVVMIRDARRAQARAAEERARADAAIERVFVAVEEEDAQRGAQPRKQRLRNTSSGGPSPEVITEPVYADFYSPVDYCGPFSNTPAGVDAMIGPSNLAKRVFGHAFAIAKTRRVNRVELIWVAVAKALGATDKGVAKVSVSLRDRWKLFWFRSTKGSHVGATIFFPKHEAIPLSSTEHCSVETPKTTEQCSEPLRPSVPKTTEQCSVTSAEISELHETRACARAETSRTDRLKTSKTRILAPDGEQQLLGEIGSLLGPAEMKKNGGAWRARIRGGRREIRALRNTIEDFKNRRSNANNPIRNRARWFTDRYQRNLVKIDEAGANGSASSKPAA